MSDRDYKYRLPEVLEAHRQTANWLVGLSTGALAGLSTFLDRPGVPWSLEMWCYAMAALFFVVTICAGVAFHLFITVYTNCYEQHARAEEDIPKAEAELKTAQAANDTTKVASLKKVIADANSDIHKFETKGKTQHNRFKASYRVLTPSFYAAVVCASCYFGIVAGEPRNSRAHGNILLLDGRHQSNACVGYDALLLDTESGVVEQLFNDTITGGTKWVRARAYARRLCEEDNAAIVSGDTVVGRASSTSTVRLGNDAPDTTIPQP